MSSNKGDVIPTMLNVHEVKTSFPESLPKSRTGFADLLMGDEKGVKT